MEERIFGFRRRVAGALNRLAQSVRPPELLAGDRDVEWSFVLSHLKSGKGKALDLGPGPFALLSVTAAQLGYEVLAMDCRSFDWPFVPMGITLKKGDILAEDFSTDTFDLIINCSTIEHIGLAGRYGTTDALGDGDLLAMGKLLRAMRPKGTMLLTLPVGHDGVFLPYHRVYGRKRLPQLLQGWRVQEECYWSKGNEAKWKPITRIEALSIDCSRWYFGLGCFVLNKEEWNVS